MTDLDAPRRPATHGGAAPLVLAFGIVAALVAIVARPSDAHATATAVWPPFVLVAGLLSIGYAAQQDGLFTALGDRLAIAAHHGLTLYLGAAIAIAVVTSTLNLDTSVAFLTPVFIAAARERGEPEQPLLIACLLLSNASSLFLRGSNLTNMIVFAHTHVTGSGFVALMWPSALAGFVVTTVVVGLVHRRDLRKNGSRPVKPAPRIRVGFGLVASVAATVVILTVDSPAIPVAAIGFVVAVDRIIRHRERVREAVRVIGAPVLAGLFGTAVALGTLGRAWSGPEALLGRFDLFATAFFAAGTANLVNNLPAASLLAARPPAHPAALLIGLNLGPNLFVTGSLTWFLWLRSARAADAQPSIRAAIRTGVVAVPCAIAAATAALVVSAHG